jgi:hypothetical protein
VKEPMRLRYDPNTPAGMRQALFTSGASPPLPPAVRAAMSSLAVQLTSTAALGGVALGTRWTSFLVKAIGANAISKLMVAAACLSAAGGVAYLAEPLVVKTSKGSRPIPRPNLPAVTTGVEPTLALPVEIKPPNPVRSGIESRPDMTSPSNPEPANAGSATPLERTSGGVAAEPRTALSGSPDERANLQIAPVPGVGVRASPLGRKGGNVTSGTEVAVEEALLERPSGTAAPEPGIASEAKLLERARSHVASDPALALKETDLHKERFGEGHMNAERELIAVEALLRLGRRTEAEDRAAPRLRLDPTGLYAKRLHQLLAEYR